MTIQEEIAANIEDVEALLRDNRNLSIAFVMARLRSLEEEMRERFRNHKCPCDSVRKSHEALKILDDRLKVAAKKFAEMQNEIDLLKKDKNNGN